MKSVLRVLVLGLVAMFVWTSSGICAMTEKVDYPTGAGKKLGRGLSNLGFGWIEILKGIDDTGKEENVYAAATWGPIRGVGNAVARTLAGAYEVVTFPVAAPANFEPVIQPEFVLDKEQQ